MYPFVIGIMINYVMTKCYMYYRIEKDKKNELYIKENTF